MHKSFAKTAFVGKNIISLPDCHSTNDFLLALVKDDKVSNGTIVQSDYQTLCRGQRGNSWEDVPGVNLIFSLLLKEHDIVL